MNKLINFIKQFTKEQVKELKTAEKIGSQYFLITDGLKQIKEKIDIKPYSIGLKLGEIKDKQFLPSFSLLDIISKYTKQKIILNDRGENIFLYKKDVFEANIKKSYVKIGICIVLNKHDEVLGYGLLKMSKQRRMLKPILDRGDYLRKEN